MVTKKDEFKTVQSKPDILIKKDNELPKMMDSKPWIYGIIFGLMGIILGIFIGHYALPVIHYDMQINPGLYTFDVGPHIAKYMDKVTESINTTGERYTGNVPMPPGEWNIKPTPIGGDKDAHGCLVGAGYSWCENKSKCIRVWEEDCAENSSKYYDGFLTMNTNLTWTNSRIVLNTTCYQTVTCDCAKNTSTPCMAMCFEWVNKTGC